MLFNLCLEAEAGTVNMQLPYADFVGSRNKNCWMTVGKKTLRNKIQGLADLSTRDILVWQEGVQTVKLGSVKLLKSMFRMGTTSLWQHFFGFTLNVIPVFSFN